jgi:hypothetical protein
MDDTLRSRRVQSADGIAHASLRQPDRDYATVQSRCDDQQYELLVCSGVAVAVTARPSRPCRAAELTASSLDSTGLSLKI